MTAEGFYGSLLINQLHDNIVSDEELSDKQKSVICEALAIAEHALLEGSNEYLQIMDVSCVIMMQIAQGSGD